MLHSENVTWMQIFNNNSSYLAHIEIRVIVVVLSVFPRRNSAENRRTLFSLLMRMTTTFPFFSSITVVQLKEEYIVKLFKIFSYHEKKSETSLYPHRTFYNYIHATA